MDKFKLCTQVIGSQRRFVTKKIENKYIYFAKRLNTEEVIQVDRKWIINNKNNILNLGVSNGKIYPIIPKGEKQCKNLKGSGTNNRGHIIDVASGIHEQRKTKNQTISKINGITPSDKTHVNKHEQEMKEILTPYANKLAENMNKTASTYFKKYPIPTGIIVKSIENNNNKLTKIMVNVAAKQAKYDPISRWMMKLTFNNPIMQLWNRFARSR